VCRGLDVAEVPLSMNPILTQLIDTGRIKSPSGEIVEVKSQISVQAGEFLQWVISEVKPKISLEVGLGYGVASLFICEALAKVKAERHIVIDPFQFGERSLEYAAESDESMARLGKKQTHFAGLGMHNLKQAGYEELIEFYDLPSFRALPQLEAEGRKVDFAFVDGWHTFDYVMVDFFYIDRLLRVGGVVIFDDLLWRPVHRPCRYIVTNRAYTVFPCPEYNADHKYSLRHRLLFNAPIISNELRRVTKPDILEPDWTLGLPDRNYVALRKENDDVLGDGARGSRTFFHHHDF
jgi:predicted O-methyltransferase YrrM